ncbi:MAG: P1 family peptidase [Eubacteriales bacterium]
MNTKRIRDYGISIGKLPTGPRNKISDVPGVTVGHYTLDDERHRTGITVLLPAPGNLYAERLTAVSHVINGFGKTAGTIQLGELGQLETPIALTNTLNVGRVADGLAGYTLEQCKRENFPCWTVNPVVGETNDSGMNDISDRPLGEREVRAAIAAACEDFDEGDVGAGKGTSCFGLKGGIGSASRQLTFDGKTFMVGALVQSNFGNTADLMIDGRPVGKRICQRIREEETAVVDRGSIMMIIGTDLPVSELQLGRVVRRAEVGLVRTGSFVGHQSGDVVLGFTTANRHRRDEGVFRSVTVLADSCLEIVFRAAAEAVEEAILNSLTASDRVIGWSGKIMRSINEFLPECL